MKIDKLERHSLSWFSYRIIITSVDIDNNPSLLGDTVGIGGCLHDRVYNWLSDECGSDADIEQFTIWFKDEADAIAFKLWWG